jgi:hypothetical protein
MFKRVLRIRDAFPDPIFFHPGSRVDKIPDPDPLKEFMNFLTQKTDHFSKIRSGLFIPDPGSGFFPIPDCGSESQIQGLKNTGSATLVRDIMCFCPGKI